MPGCAVLPPPAFQAAAHVLHPGDVVRASNGDRLETLLGSCVAVILTDPRRTTAVMSHIVHAGGRAVPGRGDTTHGVAAFSVMYGMLRAVAIEPRLCEAFVVGGGNMFPSLYGEGPHVGAQNARWVLSTLERDGIRTVGVDVGGTAYRRVRWTVGSDMPDVKAVDMRGVVQ